LTSHAGRAENIGHNEYRFFEMCLSQREVEIINGLVDKLEKVVFIEKQK